MMRSVESSMKPQAMSGRPSRGYRVATWVTSRVPHATLRHAAKIGGWLHYWIDAKKRRDYLGNTSQAAFEPAVRKPWRAFQNHALNLLELLKATSEDDDQIASRLSLHGASHIDEALKGGGGLILVTMHSGNWELAGLFLALAGYPITTVAGTQLREGWSDAVKAFKERFGITVVSPSHSMRILYRTLRSNGIVVLHIDGDVFTGGVEAALLGKTVIVPRGPAHLSRVVQAPTAFAFCRRTEGSHLEVHIESAKPPPSSVEEELALTQSHVNRLEKCILADPGQWCIFRTL